MSSGFVSGGTIENPTERDDEWRRAQAELAEKRRLKEEEGQQNDGKSLYEVLQANKAAKQEAFEEATRLKNQYRALDDDEAEFLDSVLEATRKKEAEVQKDTLEQLNAFRKRQEDAEAKALDEEPVIEAPKDEEAHWVTHGRKRKKGHELLKGVKLRRTSSAADDKEGTKKSVQDVTEKTFQEASKAPNSAPKAASATPTKPISASPPAKPSNPVSLGLGYASSDDDD